MKKQAWQDCLVAQVMSFDDGVSPAPDIARAIIGQCSKEWREHIGALWMYPEAKQSVANGIDKYAVSDGVQVVLLVRKTRRETKNSPRRSGPTAL